MVFYLDLPKPRTEGEDGLRILEFSTIGLPCLLNLKDPMLDMIIKRNLKGFLGNPS